MGSDDAMPINWSVSAGISTVVTPEDEPAVGGATCTTVVTTPPEVPALFGEAEVVALAAAPRDPFFRGDVDMGGCGRNQLQQGEVHEAGYRRDVLWFSLPVEGSVRRQGRAASRPAPDWRRGGPAGRPGAPGMTEVS